MIAPARMLVTGGAGFVGAHLVRRAIVEGHEVHVLLRPSSDAARLADLGAAVVQHRLSLADGAALRACLARVRPTHVFHLAGDTASRHEAALAQARHSVAALSDLLALLQACAEAEVPPRFLLRTGSIAEYGATPLPFREEQRERPANGYAAALVAGTHYACAVGPSLPFPIVTARLSLVYGPGQAADFLVPSLIEACVGRRPLTLQRPRDRRDILHVHDVVDALLLLADPAHQRAGIFNIGSGTTISVVALAEAIAALAGADLATIRRTPQDDPVALRLSIEKITAATDWRPRIGLAAGLKALVADARQHAMVAA